MSEWVVKLHEEASFLGPCKGDTVGEELSLGSPSSADYDSYLSDDCVKCIYTEREG